MPDFLWGVATAAYQIEGAWDEDGRGLSIWDTFCHTPGKIHNGETGDVACDHYHRWPDDLRLLSGLGVDAYRFSISWPRVLPDGTGRVNAAGLDFYDRLVDGLLAANIQPWVTLYHWDLPQCLQDNGGWANRATVPAFVAFAEVMAKRLGDRVRGWITHNEPFIAAIFGNLTGEHAPGIKDLKTALQVAHHLLLSHGDAVMALRAALPKPAPIGIALALQHVDAASDSSADQAAAQRFDGLANRWYLDPLFRAAYPPDLLPLVGPLAPDMEADDLRRIAVPLDFLGVNYYTRLVIRHDDAEPYLKASPVKPADAEMSLMWEIYPAGLGQLLERLHREYRPREVFITENGLPLADVPDGKGRIDDAPRIDYLTRHIAEVERVRGQGVPVNGFFAWSFLDNFEWALGYAMRFGLVHVDFASQRRTPKASAAWFRQRTRPR